nr:putative rhamnogalacturonate lyase c [Quercus suber]
MDAETTVVHQVRLPRQRSRQAAGWLFQLRHGSAQSSCSQVASTIQPLVRIVCISDTHNLRPTLPPGDLLIHAGDLTEWGTFDEVQTQLAWLASQPHPHKLLIAGNHDLLFDQEFLDRHPEHRDPHGRTTRDLDFGSVTYLQDEIVTLSFSEGRKVLNVYGSPWTPRYGTSAFQYPREQDVWSGRVPASTDVLITHGPPAAFNNIKPSAGCAWLRQEVARVKPRLMVFGHIHVARGKQVVTFDAAQQLYDDIVDGSRGWSALPLLALAVAWSRTRQTFGRSVQSTEMINAAVVDGMKKDVALDAFVVDL